MELLEEEYGTINLLGRKEVNYINVTGSSCLVSSITISNNQQDVVNCIYNSITELYDCPRGDDSYQYINVFPLDPLDINSIYGKFPNLLFLPSHLTL